jgi:nucleoside-diphosphate-sugar epimerase
VEGLIRLMASDHRDALNLGTDEMVSINHLVDMICGIAGKRLTKEHDLTKPQGVRGRNSDNTLLRKVLGWEPSTPLEKGLAITYKWIDGEVKKKEVGELAEVTGD